MISIQDLQDWLRTEDADIPTLRLLEESAVKAVEKLTGRYYGIPAALTEIIRFRSWPLSLANEPIGGVITSLEQWDGSAWAVVAASNYYVDGAFIWPNATYTWPLSYVRYGYPLTPPRFRVIYQAGYTLDPLNADVWSAPADVQQAVKLLVGHWFEHRESVNIGNITTEIPQGVQMLLSANSRVSV
jgi:hypothetical protein